MFPAGIVHVMRVRGQTGIFAGFGYPVFSLPLAGKWKITGEIVILILKSPLKEKAYAGFSVLRRVPLTPI